MDDDLFGHRPVIADKPLTLADLLERKRAKRRASETPNGYYAAPGTGPAGETCKTCRHAERHQSSKAWWKCGKNPRQTGSRRTDILLRSPACIGWEAA